ncbi:transport and Golgi organization protein 6 homolog [Aplochiton taeniatus]
MAHAILSALNVLTKPLGDSTVSDEHTTRQGALLSALQANQALLENHLQAEQGQEEARCLREEVRAEAVWFCPATDDPTWSFVQDCLLLLLSLSRHLKRELDLFNRSPAPSPAGRLRTPEMAPPLPPDVLSVSQQKTLAAALQFVVSLGLCPHLAPGVGVPLGRRSAFGEVVDGLARGDEAPPAERRLLNTTSALLELAEVSSLATTLFTRHLGDVMAALCQLGHRPPRLEGGANREKDICLEERKTCRKALQSLLGKVYQPIVIKELLILQGGPKQAPPGRGAGRGGALPAAPAWLRRLCGQLLSDRLVQPNGVQAVVRAILEGTGAGGDTEWRKCDGVAKILSTCPQQSVSPDAYYRLVCPQILELLHFRDKLTAQQFQRVATRAALTMLEDKPEFGQQYLLAPLLSPLQRCAQPTGQYTSTFTPTSPSTYGQSTFTPTSPSTYGQSTFTPTSPFTSPSTYGHSNFTPTSPSTYGQSTSPFTSPSTYGQSTFTPTSPSTYAAPPTSNFTSLSTSTFTSTYGHAPCQEILLWYLGVAEPQTASLALKLFCGLGPRMTDGQAGRGVAPGFQFSPGSEGGAKLITMETPSEEDDALYERLTGEQWRLECLVQLLADLKDSDLPGDFFLQLLQELTSWTAAAEEEEEEQEVNLSAMTLLEVERCLSERAEGPGYSLALLQVLAVVCEGLPHTVLLRKPTQVVDFMVSLLHRACVGLERPSGSGPGPAPGSGSPVESQSLSMGMGLVATLLSGPQVSAEDYSCMSKLLPPLEELSQKHPEALIRELASDLRTVIATRGACRLGDLTRGPRRPDDPPRSHVVKSPTETHQRPSAKEPRIRPPQTEWARVSNSAPPHPIIQPPRFPSTSQSPDPSPVRDTPTTGDPQPFPTPQAQTGPSKPGRAEPVPAPGGTYPSAADPIGTQSERHRSGTTGGHAPPRMAVSDWLLEACDPEVPTRAVALRALTRLVQERDPEAAQAQEKVLSLFLENLEHEDSFVYLSAIQGLAVLADSYPERVLQRLLGEFQGGPALSSSIKERSLETRLKVGEVLMRASRAMGELAPHLGRPLVGVFLQGTRDQDPSVRASSLSNLGELCQRLEHSLGPLAPELSACLTALIKTDREAEVRRAAVHVITQLLRGLSDKTTQVLSDVLLDLYRALKWAVRSDSDDVTVLHAQLALEEMEDVMKRFIFPPQKMEKKIVVLP